LNATALRVEIGPGVKKLGEDWVTVGVNADVDHKLLWGSHALPFDDDSVDEFYASHVIEHIPWWRVGDALAEAARVIRSGGMIELHTIDFRAVVDRYIFGSCGDWTDKDGIVGEEPLLWVASRVFSHGATYADVQWHKSCFDRPYLTRLLTDAGFVDIEDAGKPRGPEKHGVVNMGLKAVKR
jgi:hypothetical protein